MKSISSRLEGRPLLEDQILRESTSTDINR